MLLLAANEHSKLEATRAVFAAAKPERISMVEKDGRGMEFELIHVFMELKCEHILAPARHCHLGSLF